MATKIRLQRHGRKGYAYYTIVIADSRAPRDGKFIERVGSYNPNTNPATIQLNFDRALYWIQVGAQPTDTVRNILSSQGVLLMNHLLIGVKKGAFDEQEAKKRFEEWNTVKNEKNLRTSNKEKDAKDKTKAERLEAEKSVNAEKAEKLAKKRAEIAAVNAQKAVEAAKEAEKAVAETTQEAPQA